MDPDASREAGIAALQAGRADDARAHLEATLRVDPDDLRARWELGWARWKLGDLAGAAEAWEQVRAADPDWPEVDHWLGIARARAAVAAPPGPPAEVPLVAAGARVRFAAAGDTMMGSDLRKGPDGVSPDDGVGVFEGVDAWLRAADIAFLNLEGPLADGLPDAKCRPDSTNCYAFRTPTGHTRALVEAGVDVVSLANNHAMDLGPAGMEATMAALDAAGIAHAGRYGDVALLEHGGVKVALVAAHSGSCCLNVNRPEEVAAAVRAADEVADIVVLSFHGGAEGAKHRHVPRALELAWGERRGDVHAVAHAAVDAGADLVLGHGPHVLRALEVYRGRLIAYSLGNFAGYKQFGTQGGYGGTSMVLEAELAQNGVLVGARVRPAALDGLGQPRPDPSGAALEQLRELMAADFPEGGLSLDEDGVLRWEAARSGAAAP